MKLYVTCRLNPQQKIYVDIKARHRIHITPFNIECPYDREIHYYTKDDVYAELELGTVGGGALVGGLIGILGGPIGVILGGMAGAMIGASSEEEEKRRVREFYEGGY